MPIYVYDCPKHGAFEQYKSVADRQTALCPECNKVALKRPFVHTQDVKEFWPYYHVGMGCWINSRNQLKAEQKRRGSIPLETSEPDMEHTPQKPIEVSEREYYDCFRVEANSRK